MWKNFIGFDTINCIEFLFKFNFSQSNTQMDVTENLNPMLITHQSFNVVNEKWWGSQVLYWNVKESLNLFLMQIHGNDVS